MTILTHTRHLTLAVVHVQLDWAVEVSTADSMRQIEEKKGPGFFEHKYPLHGYYVYFASSCAVSALGKIEWRIRRVVYVVTCAITECLIGQVRESPRTKGTRVQFCQGG